MTDHALLSASGAQRWLSCPPSARLEEAVEEQSSEYAKEGSFAHELAELYLAQDLGLTEKSEFNKRLKELRQNPFYSEELDTYVKVYMDFAIEKINETRARTKDAVVLLEMKLDYSTWVPEGFGTGGTQGDCPSVFSTWTHHQNRPPDWSTWVRQCRGM